MRWNIMSAGLLLLLPELSLLWKLKANIHPVLREFFAHSGLRFSLEIDVYGCILSIRLSVRYLTI